MILVLSEFIFAAPRAKLYALVTRFFISIRADGDSCLLSRQGKYCLCYKKSVT
jgi:hypothetical protein